MKLTCDTAKLRDALMIADRVAGKRSSLPVLKYTLFIAGEDGLKIRATNLDIGVEISVPAKVEAEGVTAVPGDILGNVLSFLSVEKNVTIELVHENLLIQTERQSTLVKCAPYDDFPNIPIPDGGLHISFDGKLLLSGLRSVAFSAAVTDIKPEFGSVFVTKDGTSLVFAATDSSRLAEKRISLKNSPKEDIALLMPIKNVSEIIRLLETYIGDIELVLSKHQAAIIGERFRVTTRLVDGLFPDYKQIIPKTFDTEATILREELLSALKVTNIFSGKLQQVRLKVYPKDKVLEVESKTSDLGENTTKISGALEGEDCELLFNQRLLTDALTVIGVDSVTLGASTGKPLVVKPVGDPSFTYLLMPMRV